MVRSAARLPAGYDLAPPPAGCNEKTFTQSVLGVAERFGWHIGKADLRDQREQMAAYHLDDPGIPGLAFHNTMAYRSEPGWPDWTFIRRADRRLIFAELKTDAKASKLTPRQAEVLELLRCLVNVTRYPGRDPGYDVSHQDPGGPMIEVFEWRPRDWDQIVAVMK